MPDKTRKIQACFPIEPNSPRLVVKAAINQLNKRTTLVRIAVAKLELTSVTSIFAKIAVIPANSAESGAQINHCIDHGYLRRHFLSSLASSCLSGCFSKDLKLVRLFHDQAASRLASSLHAHPRSYSETYTSKHIPGSGLHTALSIHS